MPLLSDTVRPNGATFPIAIAEEVQGGLHSVANRAAMLATHASRQEVGMQFNVRDESRRYWKTGAAEYRCLDPVGLHNQPRAEWYGGVPDGVIDGDGHVTGTDNRAAINQCLAVHGACYLEAGVYALSHFVSCTAPAALLQGCGRDRTTLALLDNAAIDHNDLLAWGAFRPDCIYVGSGSTAVTIRGIHFYNNGAHRMVSNKTGLHQAGSQPISITGTGQLVEGCRFSGIGAASGSTGGYRTPGLPEVFCVNLIHEPTSTPAHADDWVYVPGAKVRDCEFVGPLAPQLDPDDFPATVSGTPEVTFVLLAGLAVTWQYGTGSVDLASTALTSPTAFFESWMAGKTATIGSLSGTPELVTIASVTSPTAAVLAAPAAAAWSGAMLRVHKRPRILYQDAEVSGCTWKNLRMWRTSATDKQLRTLHLITLADVANGVVTENLGINCDACFYYQDAWVAMGLSIFRNTLKQVTHGLGMGFAGYAWGPMAGSGRWDQVQVYENTFTHGGRMMERLYLQFADKAGTDEAYRLYNVVPRFANGLTIQTSNTEAEIAAFMDPGSATIRPQLVAVDHFSILDNDWQSYDDLYTDGIFYTDAFHSIYSLTRLNVVDNVLDHYYWLADQSRMAQVENSSLLRAYILGPQYRVGNNYRANGAPVPLYGVRDAVYQWTQSNSSPTGFTSAILGTLDWATLGATYAPVVPDTNGHVWYADSDHAGSSILLRAERVTWQGDASAALKFVFPRPYPASNDAVPLGYALVGQVFEFTNRGAASVDLYWNDAGTPGFLRTVPVNETVRLVVRAGGYAWTAVTPDAAG